MKPSATPKGNEQVAKANNGPSEGEIRLGESLKQNQPTIDGPEKVTQLRDTLEPFDESEKENYVTQIAQRLKDDSYDFNGLDFDIGIISGSEDDARMQYAEYVVNLAERNGIAPPHDLSQILGPKDSEVDYTFIEEDESSPAGNEDLINKTKKRFRELKRLHQSKELIGSINTPRGVFSIESHNDQVYLRDNRGHEIELVVNGSKLNEVRGSFGQEFEFIVPAAEKAGGWHELKLYVADGVIVIESTRLVADNESLKVIGDFSLKETTKGTYTLSFESVAAR